MSSELHSPFERSFGKEDVVVFRDLTRSLVGLRCSRSRETYAQGLVVDFGKLVPKPPRAAEQAPPDRGEWVATTWGCDVAVVDPRTGARPNSNEDFSEVLELAQHFVGERVKEVEVTPDDLSLIIQFEDGRRLELKTDFSDPELDQWFLQLPSGGSIGVTGTKTWYLRAP
jgi:hypothetical protein